MQIPLCPSCRALLRPRKGGYCPSCGELQPFSDSEPALCETCQKTPPPWEHFRFYGAYSGALVPVGVLMALMGYVIGTGGGLIVANIMSLFG